MKSVLIRYNQTLYNDKPKQMGHMKDKNGTLLTKESEVKPRRQEHFNEALNRHLSPEPPEIVMDGIRKQSTQLSNEIRSIIDWKKVLI